MSAHDDPDLGRIAYDAVFRPGMTVPGPIVHARTVRVFLGGVAFIAVVVCRNCGRTGENMICRGCFAAYCAETIECAACDCDYDEDDDG